MQDQRITITSFYRKAAKALHFPIDFLKSFFAKGVVLLGTLLYRPRRFIFFIEEEFYYETLAILRGRKKLSPLFQELKTFIQARYGVTVYNFIFQEFNNPETHFRLNVLLATAENYWKMYDGRYNYDRNIQKEIAVKFYELSNRYDYGMPESRKGVFVCYSDFSCEMKTDINHQIIKKVSKFITNKYSSYAIWNICPSSWSSVVFFMTDEDLRRSTEIQTEITDDYFRFLKRRDEFGVFIRSKFQVGFDSKQNLDNNYEGSLFYYFKDH